jgi:hypothetical protein
MASTRYVQPGRACSVAASYPRRRGAMSSCCTSRVGHWRHASASVRSARAALSGSTPGHRAARRRGARGPGEGAAGPYGPRCSPGAGAGGCPEGHGEGGQEELAPLRLERRHLPEEPGARRRLSGAIDLPPLDDMRARTHGQHATRGEAPTADGQEADAAVVWAQDPDGPGGCRRAGLLTLGRPGNLAGRHGFRLFGCDWGAALGAARESASARACPACGL